MEAQGSDALLIVYVTSLAEGIPRGQKRQAESRTGRALLAHALNRVRPGTPPLCERDIPPLLCFGPKGKPGFQALAWEFSISHSHGLVACGFSARPLGLDVERVRPFSPQLAGRIQAPGEEALAGAHPDSDSRWSQLWTCKESCMKYTGLGMSQEPGEIAFARLGPAPLLAAGGKGLCFRSLCLYRGGEPFWLTLCRGEPGPVAVEFLSAGQIAALLA